MERPGELKVEAFGSPVSPEKTFFRMADDLSPSRLNYFSDSISNPDYRSILKKMSEIGLPTSASTLMNDNSSRVANSYLEAAGRVLQSGEDSRPVEYQRLHEERSGRLAGTLASVGYEQHPETLKDFVDKRRQEHWNALIESENGSYEEAKKARLYSFSDPEWELFKEEAVRAYAAAGNGGMVELLRDQRLHSGRGLGLGDRVLTSVEKLYAQVLRHHNDELLKLRLPLGNVGQKFYDAIERIHDKKITELWRIFVSLIPSDSQDKLRHSALAFRSSPKFAEDFVSRARKYLEQSAYDMAVERVRSPVNNLNATSGDGTNLIVAYTKAQLSNNRIHMENLGPKVHGLPIWALIFYALRLGSLNAAVTLCKQGDELVRSFARFLVEYARNQGQLLTASQQELQNIYYGNASSFSDDVYKRAVYAIVAQCDVDDEFGGTLNSVGDWLWVHITRMEPLENAGNGFTLQQLQQKVKLRFPAQKTDDVEAFVAFLLSGQFEMAMGRLFQNLAYRCHAVHMTIALKCENMLVTAKEPAIGTIVIETPESVAMDLANMIRIFVADFRLNCPDVALEYFYLLSDTPAVRSTHFGHEFNSLFEFCVYKLAKETNSYQAIFGSGKLPDGSVRLGLADRFIPDPRHLMGVVAEDFVEDGRLKEAVELFQMAGRYSMLFRALTEAISSEILLPTTPGHRNSLTELAFGCAERLKTYGEQDDTYARNFFLILDLLTFLGFVSSGDYKKAVLLMEKLKLLPLVVEMVENAVAVFTDDLLPAVQACIPLVTLRTMESFVQCYLVEKERILDSRLGADVGAPLKTANLFVSGARLSDDLIKVQNGFRKQSRALLEYANRIPSQHLPNLVELMAKLDAMIA
ncbi:nuclear pore complex protein Nup93-like [Paramacrobiotus metropolitanus]|uniref:nuclear pore complex protein Nup93-like n=1 Tax=Paramacrobiotus metropolitanus TaxID=2943436 RepID=UPI0024464B58|nr:nuclear pore complex protein Nup93-like [Paramacrobiotus metropolitanus]